MSRAGEGKNESSAGRRVIVAKGSGGEGRAGQGRKARCHWRWILASCNWVVALTATCGPCEATKHCSGCGRRRRAERERYCSANINASGREEDIGGGGLEEGRVMPREQLLADTPVCRLGVDSNVCSVEYSRGSLDLVSEWVSLCLAGAGLGFRLRLRPVEAGGRRINARYWACCMQAETCRIGLEQQMKE